MRIKHWFIIVIALITVAFLFIERAMLTPFILAGIFAYIFNPIVKVLSNYLRIPRLVSIVLLYVCILSLTATVGVISSKRMSEESTDLNRVVSRVLITTKGQTSTLPDWAQPVAKDFIISLQKSKFINSFTVPEASLPFFSAAIFRIVAFLIFLFSGFYFLKDGETFVSKALAMAPKRYTIEFAVLLRKINAVLGGYLRGQLLLVAIIAVAMFIALSIVGVPFALLLAIFSGFAEIVPFIGPIVATSIAVIVVLITGTTSFGLNPLNTSLVVIVIYFVIRQLEDYLVIPHVMGRITKLHPFVIFFAVVAGGHIGGVIGLILAVPIAAVIRLLLEFSLDALSEEKLS